jgi:hypothetical protein
MSVTYLKHIEVLYTKNPIGWSKADAQAKKAAVKF